MAGFRPDLVVGALNRHGVRYLLVGGVGAALHGSPLRTGDTDVCPATDAENLDRHRPKDRDALPVLRELARQIAAGAEAQKK
jgi:hypothetical protein